MFHFVREEDTGIAITHASVFVYQCDDSGTCLDAPHSQWLTDVGDDPVEDGSFGDYACLKLELLVHKKGRSDSEHSIDRHRRHRIHNGVGFTNAQYRIL